MGVRTQRYAVHIFRLTVADRLCALRGGAFDPAFVRLLRKLSRAGGRGRQAVRMGGYHARAGVNGQTDAGDVAFCHVAARLLAAAKMAKREEQRATAA